MHRAYIDNHINRFYLVLMCTGNALDYHTFQRYKHIKHIFAQRFSVEKAKVGTHATTPPPQQLVSHLMKNIQTNKA